MHEGLYESVITRALNDAISAQASLASEGEIDPADQPHVLARHIARIVERHLAGIKSHDARLRATNAVLESIDGDEAVLPPIRHLLALSASDSPGRRTYGHVRPATPLTDAALLTNAPDEPNLATELKSEIASADSVDLLCAFVRWHGIRLLENDLRIVREAGIPFRVVTTTYLGSTERLALDRLVREFGAEVRVQYDAQRTRLHAKAWLFRRRSGFDTGYVGSSNLSRAAPLDGLEWNVRLSQVATPDLLRKFEATFDTYWNDNSFESYDPDLDRDRLDDALSEAAGRTGRDRVTISLSGLEVRPYPYQSEMLEELRAEREVHGRHRNLVVAATGTGKTVVAALDYRDLCQRMETRPSLLFVAHRKEILEQSMRTCREVLADGDFGELYVDGKRPERWGHVFASVQSLNSYGPHNIPSEHFDVVVIDEFHHAQATTYRRLLDHLQPHELLGLTATPERADGVNVQDLFDGRIASELRLWDALGADLLCPFHYFAVADGTDLRDVQWTRGRYDDRDLDRLYTGNTARAAIVLRQLGEKVLDPGAMRALGFCVSVAHAEYMAQVFNDAGIPARAVSGDTHSVDRARALQDLRARRVNALFAADLFNEGLDLPDVDTVLFLRPTESATVFLQQLGRGLRRTPDKAVLTVLDFVGHHRKEFRFDHKYRALTGETRAGLVREVERGFPFLPAGCQIVMDRQSQAIVLGNIKSQVAQRWPAIAAELRSYGDLDLPSFLREAGIDLSDVLRRGSRSWTDLRRTAGLQTPEGGPREEQLLKRSRAFAHVDDRTRARAYLDLMRPDSVHYDAMSAFEQRLAQMVFFSLWPDGGGFESIADGLAALSVEASTRSEITSVVDCVFESSRHSSVELERTQDALPLRVHARYSREEILAAVGYANLTRKPTAMMQGVAYAKDSNIDVFFVTLKKSEADYSPTTMYRDFPISPTLFHWESQSTTSLSSPTGQRYISGSSTVLLFVREQAKDEFGTSPYLCLGPATCVSHEGERPIAITWRLTHAMPAEFFNAATVAAG